MDARPATSGLRALLGAEPAGAPPRQEHPIQVTGGGAGAAGSGPDGGRAGRLRVEVGGAVQGVGFRPFVYRLATDLDLRGWVVNDARGVRLEVEGDGLRLRRFLDALRSTPPPRAVVRRLEHRWLDPAGFPDFTIRRSEGGRALEAAVLPDLATCPACRAELLDPGNRRHRYPFTNCTDCGPRFSIIRDMPYDRRTTTMAGFELCPACAGEYGDPLDRRFHAQPNACPACGPALAWWDGGGSPGPDGAAAGGPAEPARPAHPTGATDAVHPEAAEPEAVDTEVADPNAGNPNAADPSTADPDAADPVALAVEALRRGKIVAVQGLGGFHLVCDARSEDAVGRLRERKGRPTKPLAVMVPDMAALRALCRLPPGATALLEGPEAPIVLLPVRAGAEIAPSVAPGHPTLGVMLPYTPLHHLLLEAFGGPVVATSGNRSDEPICTDPREAAVRLDGIADRFLVHDRPIERPVDDSVAWMVGGAPALLRRSRGYAPLPLTLPAEVPPVLAVGGHLKATVALGRGREAWLSQHIGDLETPEAEEAFHRIVADLVRLYRIRPELVAHDLHPGYRTTGWARAWARHGLPAHGSRPGDVGSRERERPPAPRREPASRPPVAMDTVAVQHHHAHLASLLADRGETEPALGVIWDGTGYGTDGTVWGGEFLLGDAGRVERVAHLRPFRLPGGEAAVRDPRRVALALLVEAGLPLDACGPLGLAPGELRLLRSLVERGIRAPWTSSAGRLLDGFSALLGVRRRVSYEGEAAIALEHGAAAREREAYPFPLRAVAPADRAAPPGPGPEGSAASRSPDEDDEDAVAGVTDRPRWTVDWGPALEAVLRDVRFGAPVSVVSARLHNGLVEAVAAVAERVGHPRVGLSGGCFQNRLLVEGASRSLRARGFEVLLHRRVPPNDGGLALGQVAVAAARADRGMAPHGRPPHPGGGGGRAADASIRRPDPHPPGPHT